MDSLDSVRRIDLDLFGRAVAELGVRLPVAVGPAGLARELSMLAPDLIFRDLLTRGGWFRLGGVVDTAGHRVADDLAAWGEKELSGHGDDLQALCDAYAASGLRATRLIGRAHYLVAPTGTGAADFVQVEIEELQEVVSHELFTEREVASLEELFEPPHGAKVSASDPSPVTLPFFTLRRATDIGAFAKRMATRKPEPQPLHRFLHAWQTSSAGNATHFCNHWIVAVREYLDCYRQPILSATPVAAVNGLPPRFAGAYGARGLALSEALQRFDRQAGYPMAWFFHMLTTKSVPHAVAHAVVDDVQGGFSYLPERDVKVLKDWMHRPYAF